MTKREVTYDFYKNQFPPENQPSFLLPEFDGKESNLGILLTRGLHEDREMSKTAIIGKDSETSYQELDEITNKMGSSMQKIGLKGGDRVVFLSDVPRTKESIFVVLAAMKIGCVGLCPLSKLLALDQLEKVLERVQPNLIVVGELEENSHFFQFVAKLKEEKADSTPLFTILDKKHSKIQLRSLFEIQTEENVSFPVMIENSKGLTPAQFFTTSGTTGIPKLCLHFHSTLLFTVKAFVDLFSFHKNDIFLLLTSTSGTYGVISTYMALLTGATIILDSFTPATELISIHQPTVVLEGPSFYHGLLQSDFSFPSSVKYLISAGEKLQKSTFEQFQKKFKLPVYDTIGATEIGFCYISNSPGNVKAGSTGLVIPGYELKIVDEKSRKEIKQADKSGILYVKGPGNCYYFKSSEAQAKSIEDGWFCTGDLFSRDSDGFYYCLGRQDDVIMVDGYNISPVTIEEALLKHPSVSDAGVFAVYDEKVSTSKIVAAVVNKDKGKAKKEKELQEWINSEVSDTNQVDKILCVESLPRKGTGNKLNRKQLSKLL